MTQEEIKKQTHTHIHTYTQKDNISHQLIVSHTLLDITTTTTVLVIVMLKAYLRLTEEFFAHRNTARDPKPLLCGRCPLPGNYNQPWPSVGTYKVWTHFSQQPWPIFCSECSYTVSLQQGTKTWLAKTMTEWELSTFSTSFSLFLFVKSFLNPRLRKTSCCLQNCETLGSCAYRILVLF